jgi:anti-sigma B factor antagonist
MQGIKISVSEVGARQDIALITIMGYVDTTTCQELTKTLKQLIDRKRYLIVADVGAVSYISSAGWGVFVGEIKNIREQGGDLKIVQMTPEVFEVFEMLEFNRILNYYDSLEEAIDEADIIRGIDITKPEESVQRRRSQKSESVRYPAGPSIHRRSQRRRGSSGGEPSLPIKEFPLVEKIKMMVIENPFLGIKAIRRQLNTPKYGNVKLGWLQTRSVLKKLNLESKEKRYRFYRSR